MSMREGELAIGKLSKELGISTATINFYVAEGILPAPRKLNRTRAAYSDRHRRLLKLIKTMQAQGYSLTQIKQLINFYGDNAIEKLEGIGSLQPLPPVRNDPERRELEHFEPIDRDAFLCKTGVAPQLVDRLEAIGLLRPVAKDRYDVADARLVLTVQSVLDDGITLDELEHLGELVDTTRKTSMVVARLTGRYRQQLKQRDIRFRDLLEPFTWAQEYLFDRVHSEQHPNWRDELFIPGDDE